MAKEEGMESVVKRRIRWMVFSLVGLVLVLISFEVGSIVFYGVTHRRFFYADNKMNESTIAPQVQVAEAVFHPYLGFINRVGRSGPTYGTNNHGWQFAKPIIEADSLCCDYPVGRKNDEVLIGVFGGSVGAGFSLTAQSSGTFAHLLEKIPRFAGKKVRIFNFAMSGYRQPQQLLTLAYYLSLGQEFDVVINVDGFNEVVTSSRNWESGVEPTYPADTVWGEMGRQVERANVSLVSENHLLSAYHERAAAHSRRRAEECRIASCVTFHKLSELFHQFRHRTLAQSVREKVEVATLFPTIHRYTFGKDIDIFQYTADRWADSSLAMAKMLQGRGTIYVHVLQPNQWFRRSGRYTAIDPAHVYKWVIEPVNRGYEALQERIPGLKASGADVFDATAVFKGMDNRKVFVDDCCHYTDAGYEILFAAVAGEIGRLAERRL